MIRDTVDTALAQARRTSSSVPANDRSLLSRAASVTRTALKQFIAAPSIWPSSETSPRATFTPLARNVPAMSGSLTNARTSRPGSMRASMISVPAGVSAPTTITGIGGADANPIGVVSSPR